MLMFCDELLSGGYLAQENFKSTFKEEFEYCEVISESLNMAYATRKQDDFLGRVLP